jgi:putative peptidoglycan lipid II flippase
MGPLLLAMGTGQLNIIVDRTVAAAHLGDGGVHHLYLGMRLMQFPLGLVSVALTTAVFPVLNRLLARRELEAASAATGQALRTNMLLCLPAAAGLLWLGPALVAVLFERGAFQAHNTLATARALAGYAWGVPLLGAAMILSRTCMALGSLRPLVLAGLVTVVVNLVLDLALVEPFGELGLAAATSATGLVHVALLARVLGARLPGHTATQLVLAGLFPMLAATAVMLAALWGTDALLSRLSATPSALLTLLAETVVGSLAFALAARRLCPAEWQALSALWKRRRGAAA